MLGLWQRLKGDEPRGGAWKILEDLLSMWCGKVAQGSPIKKDKFSILSKWTNICHPKLVILTVLKIICFSIIAIFTSKTFTFSLRTNPPKTLAGVWPIRLFGNAKLFEAPSQTQLLLPYLQMSDVSIFSGIAAGSARRVTGKRWHVIFKIILKCIFSIFLLL